MDPEANLKEQYDIVERVIIDLSEGRRADPGDLDRLRELTQALKSWVARGGALPREWGARL